MKRYFTYVGDEDIRLVYNDVNYMGQFVSERRFLDDPRKENEEGIKNTSDRQAYGTEVGLLYGRKQRCIFHHALRLLKPGARERIQ